MDLERAIRVNIYLILITIAFSPTIAYVLVGTLLVLIIINKDLRLVIQSIKDDKALLVLIIVLVVTSVLAELWYISILFAGIFIIKVLFSQAVALYIKETDSRIIFVIILVSGTLVSMIGLLQLLAGNIEMPTSWVDSRIYEVSFRVYSTFSNPNVLAGFLNLVIIVGLVAITYHKDKIMLTLSMLGASTSLVALLFTYSRGGWISLCLALIIASMFDKRFIKYTIILISVFLSFDYFKEVGRLVPDNILKDSSIQYRVEIWIAAIKVFFRNWIFGIGSGTSWYYVKQYSDVINSYVRHVHNIYLQALVDVGIVGFISYAAFLQVLWRRLKGSLFNSSPWKILNTASFVFYVCILFFGLIDVVTSYLQLSFYVWFLIGCNRIIKEAE